VTDAIAIWLLGVFFGGLALGAGLFAILIGVRIERPLVSLVGILSFAIGVLTLAINVGGIGA
jgi:hypothetical protein